MAEIQFNTQTRDKIHDQTPAIDLHDIIHMVIANWYWFILSILVCVGAAYYYLAKTQKYTPAAPRSSSRIPERAAMSNSPHSAI